MLSGLYLVTLLLCTFISYKYISQKLWYFSCKGNPLHFELYFESLPLQSRFLSHLLKSRKKHVVMFCCCFVYLLPLQTRDGLLHLLWNNSALFCCHLNSIKPNLVAHNVQCSVEADWALLIQVLLVYFTSDFV